MPMSGRFCLKSAVSTHASRTESTNASNDSSLVHIWNYLLAGVVMAGRLGVMRKPSLIGARHDQAAAPRSSALHRLWLSLRQFEIHRDGVVVRQWPARRNLSRQ